MRLARDQLVFRALVVLDEVVDDCKEAPVRPTIGHRFALMLLYAVSNGDRHAYDDFWQIVQDRQAGANSQSVGCTKRQTGARTCLMGIALSVGVDFDTEYQRELRIARMLFEARAALRQRDSAPAEHRRRLREDGWQYAADDPAKPE